MVKGPETYTRSEMNHFAKMAKAIHNVDAKRGHNLSTAQFLDSEFSDNSSY